jgi:ribose-phosphate pyrophosphokinase
MRNIVFALPGNEELAERIVSALPAIKGEAELRHFPDEESYVRTETDVLGSRVILVATLDHPDGKILPLYFLSKLCKELGAAKLTLVAPYLPYMRQDKRFKPGEAVTNKYFSELLSGFIDELITIDPHLHRMHSLSEIYPIPCQTLHVSPLIANYIKQNIKDPLLIGPDSESEQWIAEVAGMAKCPYLILQKERLGDKEVKISGPINKEYENSTPVLVDDIISTAYTMIKTVSLLKKESMRLPVCIGIHGLFPGNAFVELNASGVSDIVTSNTVRHSTNRIDVTGLIVSSLAG